MTIGADDYLSECSEDIMFYGSDSHEVLKCLEEEPLMFSRSRSFASVVVLVAVSAGLMAGCGKKQPKAEIRLPRTAQVTADGNAWGAGQGTDSSDLAGGSNAPGFGTNSWEAGGAPGLNGFDSSDSMSLSDDFMNGSSAADIALVDADTGDFANTAAANGVDAGTFTAELDMVFFPFDSSDITGENQTILNNHASWLAENSTIMVQVEGHTDERGTEEYNIALGQRRADAIRSYLIENGIDANRVSTISYGKMRPLTFGVEEGDHALNRRGMFLVFELEDGSVASAF